MKAYFPDKKSMKFLRAASAAASLLLIAAVRAFVTVYEPMLALCIIISVIAVILIFVYLPMYFSSLSYTADDKEITKTGGVIFRKSQTIKLASIQYTIMIVTPFSERTGLNFILFYVYGGSLLLTYLKKCDMAELLALSETER